MRKLRECLLGINRLLGEVPVGATNSQFNLIQNLRQHCFELQWEPHNIVVIKV